MSRVHDQNSFLGASYISYTKSNLRGECNILEWYECPDSQSLALMDLALQALALEVFHLTSIRMARNAGGGTDMSTVTTM